MPGIVEILPVQTTLGWKRKAGAAVKGKLGG
jgi:hypothetical protein